MSFAQISMRCAFIRITVFLWAGLSRFMLDSPVPFVAATTDDTPVPST